VHNAGKFNTATGAGALSNNTIGNDNTANGVGRLSSNTLGSDNTASGLSALSSNTSGDLNVAYGVEALFSNTTGTANTAIGTSALQNNITGTGNVALGAGAGSGITTADFVIAIGEDVAGANVSGSCFISNIRGVTTANADAIPVLIDSLGQLGTASSSRRFKKEIKPMDKASEAILALKPVTFHYKSDKANTPQFGLIAEEVAEVNPD
jgi:Chaperone of endosialidase